jgi:hypothetical protein
MKDSCNNPENSILETSLSANGKNQLNCPLIISKYIWK